MINRKILLITWGLGYIGSHAVVAFEQAWYKTVIIDNFINSTRKSLEGIEKILGYCPDFYECDIRDKIWLEKIFQKYSFDGVIHFAGLKAVGESCIHIHQYQDNNVSWSIVLFWVMEKFWIKKIVFSSSATVYRSDNISPLTENMPVGTTNPYGTSKLVIEKLLEDYVVHSNWWVTILRYFNPIWAHISWFIGETPNGVPNNLLPYVLEVALGKREILRVFWNDYDTPDGTWIRDYIDINDLIDAHILAFQKISSWRIKTYNVWTGKGISVLEIINQVEQITERPIPYIFDLRRSGDIASVFADSQFIKQELWWTPKKSIQDSIWTAWNFISTRVD